MDCIIAKKTNIIGIIVAGVTVFGLGINILLIPVWDITGAAIAYLLSQFVYWLPVTISHRGFFMFLMNSGKYFLF